MGAPTGTIPAKSACESKVALFVLNYEALCQVQVMHDLSSSPPPLQIRKTMTPYVIVLVSAGH